MVDFGRRRHPSEIPLMSIFRIIPILGTRMTRSVFSISKAKAKSGTVATLAKHLINLGE